MIYSHRSHAPDLAGASISLDRAIGESVLIRAVEIRGLVQDERLLGSPMGSHRSRLTVLLAGDATVFAGDQPLVLAPGGFVASSRIGATRSRAANCRILEIDWDSGWAGGGVLESDLVRGTLSEPTLARLEQFARALGAPELAPAPALAAFRALARDGLPFDLRALERELTPSALDDRRVMDALDTVLCRLEHSPDTQDLIALLGFTRRTLSRRLRQLSECYRMDAGAYDWRSERDVYRGIVAAMFLSHPDATTIGVSRMLGYRSAEALCHAFRRAGLPSPGRVRRALGL